MAEYRPRIRKKGKQQKRRRKRNPIKSYNGQRQMTIQQKLVAIAEKQVGIREEGGNNNGIHIREYQQATWLRPDSWAWCAAFVDWCIREWLHDTEVAARLSLDTAKQADEWRPKTASAFDLMNWAKKHNIYVCDEQQPAMTGDIVIYDFSHCGIVRYDQLPSKDYIETIEGNTNGKGERDSVSGDGVWAKQRKVNTVRAYLRIIV